MSRWNIIFVSFSTFYILSFFYSCHLFLVLPSNPKQSPSIYSPYFIICLPVCLSVFFIPLVAPFWLRSSYSFSVTLWPTGGLAWISPLTTVLYPPPPTPSPHGKDEGRTSVTIYTMNNESQLSVHSTQQGCTCASYWSTTMDNRLTFLTKIPFYNIVIFWLFTWAVGHNQISVMKDPVT